MAQTKTPTKSEPRLAGSPLRLAARLMETPLSGSLLFRVASRSMQLDRIHDTPIPRDTVPYRPLHLMVRPAAPEEESDG